VVDGRIAVPATLEELQKFAAPMPGGLGLTHVAAQ